MAIVLRSIVIASAFVSLNLWAAEADQKECEVDLVAARQTLTEYQRDWKDGLGHRGGMGQTPVQNDQTMAIGIELGLIPWGVKYQFASTLEEAIAHRLKVRAYYEQKGALYEDTILPALYIIGDEEALDLKFNPEATDGTANKVPVPPEKAEIMFQNGVYQIDATGVPTLIPRDQVYRRTSNNGVFYHRVSDLTENFGKNSFTQNAWVAYPSHGIHDYATWKETDAAKKLRKQAQAYANMGYTWHFDRKEDFVTGLNMARATVRSKPKFVVQEDGTLVQDGRIELEAHRSRYADKETYNRMLGTLNSGQGYFVGTYAPDGTLVGGEFGPRAGNRLYGDTVFYKDDPLMAKFATLALFDALYAGGQTYSDPGMISSYTNSMGATFVPFDEFNEKMNSGPAEPIILPANWDPRPSDYLNNLFAELAKKKNVGLGNLKVVRRGPVDDSAARSAAEKVGMERASVDLVFVSSPAEAAADVVKRDWRSLPIYVEVPADKHFINPQIMSSPLAFLKAAFSGEVGAKAYFVGSQRYPEASKPVPLKQIIDVLDFKSEINEPEFVRVAPFTVRVSGWGFTEAEK